MSRRPIEIGEAGLRVVGNIRALRRMHGMSYAEMSRRLKRAGRPIGEQGLRRLEALERRIDVDDLVAIATTLHTTTEALIHGTEHRLAAADVEATLGGPDGARGQERPS